MIEQIVLNSFCITKKIPTIENNKYEIRNRLVCSYKVAYLRKNKYKKSGPRLI